VLGALYCLFVLQRLTAPARCILRRSGRNSKYLVRPARSCRAWP